MGSEMCIRDSTLAESVATAESCRKLGCRAEAWELDVANIASIKHFVDQAMQHYGRIDTLVNNAGHNQPKPAIDYTEADFDTIVDINLKGAFFMSTALARHMIASKQGGSIITITSQAGVVGAPLRSIYGAAKSGAGHLVRTLAAEWASQRITVNAIAPTFTRTPMLEKALQNPDFARNLEKVPMGRTAEPDEIAAAVVFLASPAARMITGQTLCVDGGFTAV